MFNGNGNRIKHITNQSTWNRDLSLTKKANGCFYY